MTVEDDHDYKLCPGAEWLKSWKDATWTDQSSTWTNQSSDEHVTCSKIWPGSSEFIGHNSFDAKNNIFDLLGLELKVSLCHVLSATSKPGEKSIQVRSIKNLARQAVMEISFLVAQFFSSESHAKKLYTLWRYFLASKTVVAEFFLYRFKVWPFLDPVTQFNPSYISISPIHLSWSNINFVQGSVIFKV